MNINNTTMLHEINLLSHNRLERVQELKSKQLPNIPLSEKLRSNDIHRIAKYTDTSIFDKDKCCLWTGFIVNEHKRKGKGTYINFYFKNKKKVTLHRLLYINFKGELSNNEYISYTCPNKGKCCNINHMYKYSYLTNSHKNKNFDKKDIIDLPDDFKIVFYL